MTTRLPHAFRAMAVADAIGNDFEFWSPKPKDVLDFIKKDSQVVITDDTQMALFGLEGINNAADTGHYIDEVQRQYLNWLDTQNLKRPSRSAKGLHAEPMMYSVQAPGLTCLNSLATRKKGLPVENDSNGCGALMRLLPFVGLLETNRHTAHSVAAYTSQYTHRGSEIDEVTSSYMGLAQDILDGTAVKLKKAPVTRWGQGWTAASCFMMAYQAWSNAASFEDLLVQSIAHPGDSDSVAAVAGGLWGLAGGEVPDRLVARVKEMPVVDRVTKQYLEKFYEQR